MVSLLYDFKCMTPKTCCMTPKTVNLHHIRIYKFRDDWSIDSGNSAFFPRTSANFETETDMHHILITSETTFQMDRGKLQKKELVQDINKFESFKCF